MRIDVLTIFPEMFQGPLQASIVKRAADRGLVNINLVDIREHSRDKHRSVDDYPYGGGPGMVMRPEPIFAAWEALGPPADRHRVILLSPQGKLFSQGKAKELADLEQLVLICGHYEGVDERVALYLAQEELSIGDYVLSGGELAAMVVIDAVVRLLPGVLGAAASLQEESFGEGLLEYPQYTRPPEFRGYKVPEILLSGHHEAIRRWRRKEALRRTRERRPDLWQRFHPTEEDRELLAELEREEGRNAQWTS
ncbi:MAG: tRNA (guanosine(37)-N1)-methyltransferase TrmD [Clostridia bacterium]|nr:tRNA (guanosine(37)-N1)-methyltransferase TrmD [Clostridia bacterium]MDH7572415.1 tRNA (guanosine(37)-N1)-methyltransferase TrmD [Clostridia bacterium]